MKANIVKGVGYSFLSPVIVGVTLGLFYSLTLEGGSSATFFALLLSAVANAHIVGLAMAFFVVPIYLYSVKKGMVNYSVILTAGLLGGAVFSYIFAATSGAAFLVNAIMSGLAAGLFLFGLRRSSVKLA
ncbi:hypothetical protein [Pseudoalteromonas xiamenensis]|uniref:Uncharacterized protein n=1 Tax=Pseudoalteromonas xiamenensis TaxID=882626 RepID=A0A975DHX5_9GAMM|nr:hypothetical protein [Pseudoalteromonas xiamenensis]QTH71495.1 hypothetical protein J5O05_00410 [Pseudoalteromonas xiamenensis]